LKFHELQYACFSVLHVLIQIFPRIHFKVVVTYDYQIEQALWCRIDDVFHLPEVHEGAHFPLFGLVGKGAFIKVGGRNHRDILPYEQFDSRHHD